MKKRILTGIAIAGAAALALTGCATGGGGGGGGGDELISVGFAQTGSESGWRSANTESMKTAFSEENGFDLTFNAADNDPAAQIAAVRSFINQGVDAIVIAPIVSDGWDDVLQEAKDAGIPVILEDRTVSSSDDLYASWVGLDFKKEGVTAEPGRPRPSATRRPTWWCSRARPVRLPPTTARRASPRRSREPAS